MFSFGQFAQSVVNTTYDAGSYLWQMFTGTGGSSGVSAGGSGGTTFADVVHSASSEIFNPLVVLIFALALAYFLYGVVKYMRSVENESERKKATQIIIWGLVGLAVMISVWGLVKVLTNSLGADYQTVPVVRKY